MNVIHSSSLTGSTSAYAGLRQGRVNNREVSGTETGDTQTKNGVVRQRTGPAQMPAVAGPANLPTAVNTTIDDGSQQTYNNRTRKALDAYHQYGKLTDPQLLGAPVSGVDDYA